MPAIGRPGHRIDGSSMSPVDKNVVSICCIPDLYCFVISRRGNAFAPRVPCHRTHGIRGVSRIDESVASIDGIPDLYIIARRGDTLTIRRPRHCKHPTTMTGIGIEGGSW